MLKRYLFRMEGVVAGILLILSAYTLYDTTQFPQLSAQVEMLGPGFLPRLVVAVLVILSVLLLLSKPDSTAEEPVATSKRTLMVQAGVLLAVALYAAVLKPLGFIVATVLLLAGLLWLSGIRRPWVLAAVSIVTVLALYYGFGVLLRVPLPHGVLG